MTGQAPCRLAFLGDRRIAWESLCALTQAPFAQAFEVRVLVTNAEIAGRFAAVSGTADRCWLANDARRSGELLQAVTSERIDVLVSVQHNWIIPAQVLDAVGRKAFNLHNAKLPDYRGYNSIAHALLNDDRVYESTLHWIADGVDEGDVAFVESTGILPADTALSLYLRTIDASLRAVRRLFLALAGGGSIPRRPTGRGVGAFYPKNSLDALADVTDVADPERRARLVRALYFPPYNSAWSRVNGVRHRMLPEGESEAAFDQRTPANQPDYRGIPARTQR